MQLQAAKLIILPVKTNPKGAGSWSLKVEKLGAPNWQSPGERRKANHGESQRNSQRKNTQTW